MGPGSYRVRGKPHPAGILELNFKAQIKVFQPWSWSAINKNNGFLPRRLGSGSGEPPKSEIPPISPGLFGGQGLVLTLASYLWPWTIHFTCLSLSFLIFKKGCFQSEP